MILSRYLSLTNVTLSLYVSDQGHIVFLSVSEQCHSLPIGL